LAIRLIPEQIEYNVKGIDNESQGARPQGDRKGAYTGSFFSESWSRVLESKMGEVFPDRSCYTAREETFPHSTTFLRKVFVEEGPMPHIKEKES
jgi:hypothetical protein